MHTKLSTICVQNKKDGVGEFIYFSILNIIPYFQSKQNWTTLMHKRKNVRMKFLLLSTQSIKDREVWRRINLYLHSFFNNKNLKFYFSPEDHQKVSGNRSWLCRLIPPPPSPTKFHICDYLRSHSLFFFWLSHTYIW